MGTVQLFTGGLVFYSTSDPWGSFLPARTSGCFGTAGFSGCNNNSWYYRILSGIHLRFFHKRHGHTGRKRSELLRDPFQLDLLP